MVTGKINEEATFLLRSFGESLVPMINFCEPVVADLNDSSCTIVLPLNQKTKNHLGSMYFGALAVGADCAAGLLAMHHIQHCSQPISIVFKYSSAEYLKRPEGDVHFTCSDGDSVAQTVAAIVANPQRVTIPMHITATVPTLFGDEPVAKFVLGLSMK